MHIGFTGSGNFNNIKSFARKFSRGDFLGDLVILIQYGHATGTGGYVQGRDFINPAMQPIFDEIQESIWEKVNNA
jgi:hypothetical protein